MKNGDYVFEISGFGDTFFKNMNGHILCVIIIVKGLFKN